MWRIKDFLWIKYRPKPCLTGEEYSHAKNVLRIERRATRSCFWTAADKEYRRNRQPKWKRTRSYCHVVSERATDKELQDVASRCFAGALKGDKTELVVQKATELGVKRNRRLFQSILLRVHERKQAGTAEQGGAGSGQSSACAPAAPEAVVYYDDLNERARLRAEEY